MLAWLLYRERRIVGGVVVLCSVSSGSSVGLGDYVGIGIYREGRGGRNSKYKADKCNTCMT